MKHLLLFGTLICAIHLSLGQNVPEKYADDFNNIMMSEVSTFQNKTVSKLLKKYPKDPWVYWIAAKACNPITEIPQCVEFYQQSLAVDSTFGPGYSGIASYTELNSHEDTLKAIELYSKSIQYGPIDPFDYYIRSELYCGIGEIPLAILDFKTAAEHPEMDPTPLPALYTTLLLADNKQDAAYSYIQTSEFFNSSMFWGKNLTLKLYYFCVQRGDQALACKIFQEFAQNLEMIPDYEWSDELLTIKKACP